MYDIRQFKPALYLLVILGITGFAIAAEEPALWVLSVGGVMLNVWLVRTKRFSPMPRWLSNGIVILASLFVGQQLARVSGTPILLIGQFLVLLQLIKLFEQRANRDYVQLIVLSSLLMVAAAISTASLAFGVILAVYVYLALYCFLLFHLKVEADKAKAAQTLPADKLNEATLRQDQRYLPRSMRRLTFLVALISLASAVVVFLFFPRGSGAGMLGQLQLHPPEVLTGFSDDVQFNEVAKITQNMSPVATVEVWHDDKKVETGSLRLRGSTVDRYGQGRNGEWQWQHTGQFFDDPIEAEQKFSGHHAGFRGNDIDVPSDGLWRQVVNLDPIGAKSIFALAGVRSITPQKDLRFAYCTLDETMQRTEGLNTSLRYEVISNGDLTLPRPAQLIFRATQSHDISPEIVAFANDPEVSGHFQSKRSTTAIVTDYDEEIASNIERYFKTHFNYTLDLSDSASKFVDKDPLAVFVTEPKNGGTRAGHCEYFAGAMTLACQSLGLQARMVVGFVTDEYNSVGGYFQVRQCHAHTWVEVLTKRGWVTFDPTSGRELNPNETRSVWQRLKHVFDWMEYKWANSVVAYDGSRRENLIQKVDNSLVRGAYRSTERFYRLRAWWRSLHILDQAEFWSISSKLIVGVIIVMALIIVAAVAWYLIEQRRIRRRAARIGLSALPVPDQIRLAKQLGFFEEMIDVLQKHNIHRPRHLTPREFSRGLSFLPTEAFNTVESLTRIFYRVRYGNARVQPTQQRRLSAAVERLTESLKAPAD